MNYKIKPITYFLIVTIIFHCSVPSNGSASKKEVNKNIPNWINNLPVSNKYWYGIGISNKKDNYNYRELALNDATKEIASQIKIEISAKIELLQNETDYIFTESMNKTISSRVQETLPGIELLENYEDDIFYYVLSRLSIEKYNTFIEDQRKNAINIAIENIKNSEKFSHQSPQLIIDAYNSVLPYMEIPIEVDYQIGGKLKNNLFSIITYKMNEYLNRFDLKLLQGEIDATVRGNDIIKFSVQCLDKINGDPIENIPLIAKLDENQLNDFTTTNKKGVGEFFIQQLTNKKSVRRIVITIDEKKLMSQKILPSNKINTQITQIINVKSPVIFVSIFEENLESNSNFHCIENVLKEQFVKFYGAKFTNNESIANLIVKGEFNTKPKGDPYQHSKTSPILYNAYAEFKFYIFDNLYNKEIYSKTVNSIGKSFIGFEDAGKDGCKRIEEKISEKEFEKIMKALE